MNPIHYMNALTLLYGYIIDALPFRSIVLGKRSAHSLGQLGTLVLILIGLFQFIIIAKIDVKSHDQEINS